MYLSNLSQVLIRNESLLLATTPLLINMPNDELSQSLTSLNKECDITYFDNNFELHQQHQQNQQCHCVFAAHYQTQKKHDLVIIQFPKSKQELLFTFAMLAQCSTAETRILIVGENKSGIKSINKLLKEQTNFCDKIDSARHCTLVETQLSNHHRVFNLEEWFHYYNVAIGSLTFKVAALPGVFSQAKLDTGTQVLLNNLPKEVTGKVLDFGCGAGVIACYLGLSCSQSELTLADVSALALVSSEKTLSLNGLTGKVIATNSLSDITEKYQHVISNPPFHQGIKTHYEATERFLAGVKKHLNKQGSLTIVANSFLKYQPIIEQSLGQTEILAVERGFTIYHARLKR
ncbi:methyltransferase [Thalassotalea castellviae]|uniref:Ribosomal RNA small subunit methyltransferase C n=1 Tax=Thalassotalea castellviae TaxID=3075612 RepID=A0ABU2ZZ87_9GAMM|nr:methyltransferase [Thalassotalea sp. W431]MDT0603234.1 methyltransferase [Thalassotalea sp. W431]